MKPILTCFELTTFEVDFLLQPLRSKAQKPSAMTNLVNTNFISNGYTTISGTYGSKIFENFLRHFCAILQHNFCRNASRATATLPKAVSLTRANPIPACPGPAAPRLWRLCRLAERA